MQQEMMTDYRTTLREELAARCKQNPRYSLRAFARDLKLAPSRLSEILNGKQGLSRVAAERVARALGYTTSESERFCDLVESMHARSRRGREIARIKLKKHEVPTERHQMHVDAFRAISDWYHFALLELTNVDGFRSDAKWIAKKLGVSEFEVQLALERLARLGLIKRVGDKVVPVYETGELPGGVPSDGAKTFLSQLLAKAQDALRLQPFEERAFDADILAIDKSKLPEAKKAIREFRHRFCTDIGEAAPRDGLYCLGIQFFELGEKGGKS
jgi:uncharacterized protein (TIGR02147 family)